MRAALPARGRGGYKPPVRARLIRGVLWLCGFGLLWVPVLDDPPLATGAYVQDVTTTSAIVAAITRSAAQVEATLSDGGAVVAIVRGAENRRHHTVRFERLEPGHRYAYVLREVGGGEIGSGRISTAPADDRAPVHFAFLGDSGDQPWWVWLQRSPAMNLPARWGWFGCSTAVTGIGRAVAAFEPDFVLHLGDVVYPWGLNAHYSSGFFRPFAAAMHDAPFYAVPGNHDTMDSDGVQLLANLRLPANEVTGDGRLFSFARGPVRIIGLDCNTDRSGGHYDADHPAHRFLMAELAAATEPWIFVASHFPMRSWSRQGDSRELLPGMLPSLIDRGVSIYLAGHDHTYQRFGEPDGPEPVLLVSGGGGKDLYDIAQAKLGPRPVVAAKAYHWGAVTVQGGRLHVEARGLDGAVIDRFEVAPPGGPLLERIRGQNPARARRIEALGKALGKG